MFLWRRVEAVVAITAPILLGRVPRRQCPAVVAEHDPLEQIGNLWPASRCRTRPLLARIAWTLSHSSRLDDGWMFRLVPLILVPQLTEVGPVAEEFV